MKDAEHFWRMAGDSLRFEYRGGAVTHLEGVHTTGWRTMPDIVTAHVPLGHAIIELEGGTKIPLKTGECLCIGLGMTHRITMTSQQEISRWSHFNYFAFGSLNLSTLIRPHLVIKGDAAEKIGDLNAALAENRVAAPSLRRAIAHQAMGFSLLRILVDNAELPTQSLERVQELQRLAPVLECIHRDLEGALDQERLAKIAHLSVSRFRAVFQHALGTAPRDYIGGLRLQRAQEFLLSTDLPVNEIAARTGHDDPFHFSRIFKKKCGVSPSEYRNRARINAVM